VRPVLEFKHVSKSFVSGGQRQRVLKDVSFQLEPAEFLAVVGPSGSGKTTLLSLAGLLLHCDEGEIWLSGHCVSDAGPKEMSSIRRNEFGFVFQNFNLIPVLSALENVELALHGLELNRRRRRVRALESLERVGLQGLEKRRPGELSGGQQQRVGIARAFVRKPKLMIVDEPTASLDSATRYGIILLLRELSNRCGTTLLLSTHDEKVAKAAKRIVEIDNGKLSEGKVT